MPHAQSHVKPAREEMSTQPSVRCFGVARKSLAAHSDVIRRALRTSPNLRVNPSVHSKRPPRAPKKPSYNAAHSPAMAGIMCSTHRCNSKRNPAPSMHENHAQTRHTRQTWLLALTMLEDRSTLLLAQSCTDAQLLQEFRATARRANCCD